MLSLICHDEKSVLIICNDKSIHSYVLASCVLVVSCLAVLNTQFRLITHGIVQFVISVEHINLTFLVPLLVPYFIQLTF